MMRQNKGLYHLLLAGGFSLLVPSLSLAQHSQSNVSRNLRSIESEITDTKERVSELDEQAQQLKETEDSLRSRLILAAARSQSLEVDLAKIENRLENLRRQEVTKMAAMDSRKAELESTIAGLQRLNKRPPQILLLSPGTTHDAIRSAILLRATFPVLTERAKSLGQDLQMLAATRRAIKQDFAKLQTMQNELMTEHTVLRDLTQIAASRRKLTERESMRHTEQVAALAEKAYDLKDLLNRLNELQRNMPRPAPARQNPSQPIGLVPKMGNMRLPAQGTFVMQFGDELRSGGNASGIIIQTSADAMVTAPSEGRVAYADIFKSYGLLLIIEHAKGYHTLISGFSVLNAVVNQWVVTGEPIGQMGQDDSGTKLYVELRADGQSVNPLPWFAALNKKVNG